MSYQVDATISSLYRSDHSGWRFHVFCPDSCFVLFVLTIQENLNINPNVRKRKEISSCDRIATWSRPCSGDSSSSLVTLNWTNLTQEKCLWFCTKDSPAILNTRIFNSLLPCTNTSHLTSLTSLLLTAEVKKLDPETGHQNKVFHVLILIFFTPCLLHTSKWWTTRCNWSSPISQKNATKGVTPVFVKQACHPKNPDMHSWEEVAQSALLAGVFTRLKGIRCLKRNKQQVCISRGQSQICLYLMDMLRNTCKYINHLWRLYVQWVWTRNKIS